MSLQPTSNHCVCRMLHAARLIGSRGPGTGRYKHIHARTTRRQRYGLCVSWHHQPTGFVSTTSSAYPTYNPTYLISRVHHSMLCHPPPPFTPRFSLVIGEKARPFPSEHRILTNNSKDHKKRTFSTLYSTSMRDHPPPQSIISCCFSHRSAFSVPSIHAVTSWRRWSCPQ